MLRMALPMMIGMTSHMFLNIIDGIYVSRLGMEESLAVLNYGFPFFYLIFAVFNGLTSGTTSVMARFLGAREKERAENALGQIVWIAMGIFIAFVAIYPFVLPQYLAAQKASALGGALTRDYLNTMFAGVPFLILALLWGSGLRAEGNTRTLMMGLMAGTLLNIAGAPFLIFHGFRFAGMDWSGLGLGVKGAGLASAASNLVTAAIVLAIYLRKRTVLSLRFWPDWSERSGLKDAFRVGLPSIVSQSLTGINIFVLTRLAAEFGPAAQAAIGIGSRLETLAVFPSLSIMVAILSLVGQNYGAKRYDRVAQSVRMGLATAFLTLTAVGILVHLFRGALLAKFHPDPSSFPAAYHYLGLTTLAYGFAGISIVSSGAFQGLGRGMPFLFLSTLRQLLIAAPLGWFLAHTRGEYGLHFAPLIASALTALIASSWILAAVGRLRKRPEPAASPAVTVAA
ncbi:MAG TPA: MATE family efflux transporter [Fibrobacteria bacterium]|nr:MATE family efflux transporter [Fibrobacteria bacterium]